MRETAGEPESPLFPSRHGGPLTRDAIERRLAKHVATARRDCPTLGAKRVSMHVLRHTAAIPLLNAGIDTSTIALWRGHEQERTTHVYLHADLALKQRTVDRITPPNGHPGALPRTGHPACLPRGSIARLRCRSPPKSSAP
jgi:integrase/recombinase XerD